ncbi:putative caspase-16, partial [Gracilinanus agilis]|uniref:putative caspase-16 n=1 Tax=Gracilinanus agilis TaxID=191870 RepID=UPI001CFDA037
VSSNGYSPKNPDQVDILRVYSAAEGYVAYRNENGSDFIQTLVEVIIADPDQDLLELLTEVNKRLCEMEVLGPDCDEIRKMSLEIRSSLRKQLYLK